MDEYLRNGHWCIFEIDNRIRKDSIFQSHKVIVCFSDPVWLSAFSFRFVDPRNARFVWMAADCHGNSFFGVLWVFGFFGFYEGGLFVQRIDQNWKCFKVGWIRKSIWSITGLDHFLLYCWILSLIPTKKICTRWNQSKKKNFRFDFWVSGISR